MLKVVAQAALRLEFAEIGEQPLLVRVADRPVLVDARIAAAEARIIARSWGQASLGQ